MRILLAVVLLATAIFAQDSPPIFGGAVRQAGQSLTGILWPRADVVFLDASNNLYVQRACGFGLKRVGVYGTAGILVGIDYRPADGLLYGLDDKGFLYTIDSQGNATSVNAIGVANSAYGDIRSLMDFNPVVNALRLIGANDGNFALVNSGGNLNQTVQQNAISYVVGDVNFGVNPNLVAGSYTNNVAGAANTIFYGIDYVQNTLVTIAELNAAGSSNTGGGKLRTLGRLIKGNKLFDVGATVDFDIYTVDGVNRLIGVNGNSVFTLTLPSPFSNLQDIPVRSIPLSINADFLDISVGPAVACKE